MTNEKRLIQILKTLKHEPLEQAPPDKIGISVSQVNIIDKLSLAGELSVKELAKNLHLTPPTISVGIRKLENTGLVKRYSHKEDGRLVLLKLTKKGENLYNQIEEYRNNRVMKILNKLDPTEQDQMLTLLEKALD